MKECLHDAFNQSCRWGIEWWGKLGECWLNFWTPPAPDVMLDPVDYDPAATIAFLGDALDDSNPNSRAFTLMTDIVSVLHAAGNAEPEQFVYEFPQPLGVTYVLEEVTES